jgi:DNA-binding NarL/FixJ family response regulator
MRLVLVEDHLLFRESFRIALEAIGGHRVVGEAGSGREALELVATVKPDLLVVDLMLTDTDGVAFLRELRRRGHAVPALMLTRIGHPLFQEDARGQGAIGYALKHDPLPEVLRAIEHTGRGEPYISPNLLALQAEVDPAQHAGLQALSPREREVFCRTLEGCSAKETAQALCISVKTVQAHRLQINRKLGVHSPAQFASLVGKHGLLLG